MSFLIGEWRIIDELVSKFQITEENFYLMPLEKRNELTERFNRNELQKGGKSKPRNISAVVADPGIPELHGVPQSITNLMFKESRDISKDPTSILKGHGDSFCILN